jgi:surface polysaccharide O-acyltransferase-like enzyme
MTTSVRLREVGLKGGVYSSLNSSQNRMQGIAQPNIAPNLADASNFEIAKKKVQKRQLFYRQVLKFNYFETILLFLMMLNSIIQPSYVNTIYFVYSICITLISTTRDPKMIHKKFSLSIAMIVISFLALATKSVFVFLMLKDKKIPTYNEGDLLFYRNFGIIIN